MTGLSLRRIKKGLNNFINLLHGYNIYVNRNKMRLIDEAVKLMNKKPASFADLGGVWKVNAAYTLYTSKIYKIPGSLVDTNFNPEVDTLLEKHPLIKKVSGNFGDKGVITQLNNPDMVFFFDVLLHQVTPDWDTILERYSSVTKCFVIYNQQITSYKNTIRLTDLNVTAYKELVPARSDDVYDFIFSNKDVLNTEYNKPWKDIHQIWQWGITDEDLRKKLSSLGFKEIYYKNYGNFGELRDFEDHGFIFINSAFL